MNPAGQRLQPRAQNDKTIAQNDEEIAELRQQGTYLSNQTFETKCQDGMTRTHHGLYFICDGGGVLSVDVSDPSLQGSDRNVRVLWME